MVKGVKTAVEETVVITIGFVSFVASIKHGLSKLGFGLPDCAVCIVVALSVRVEVEPATVTVEVI